MFVSFLIIFCRGGMTFSVCRRSWCWSDLRNKDRTHNELSSGFERALRVFHIHDRAAPDQDLSFVLLAEVGNAVCIVIRSTLRYRS